MRKQSSICLFLLLGIFVISEMAFAGGDFKSKIQGKINSSRNIQYNLDSLGSQSIVQEAGWAQGQYEPYYTQPGKKQVSVQDVNQFVAPGQMANVPALAAAREKDDTAASPIVSSYAVYKTDYKAEIEEDVVTVKGSVTFEVFRKGWAKIPLMRTDVGLIDASVNRGISFVTMQGGRYYLMIDRPGRYNLDVEFLIKAKRERENGPGNFNLEVIPAPISQFEMVMPEDEVEIFIEPSIKTELKRESKKTVAWAVMPNTNTISVRWTKALPKETIVPVKLEPKVYADTTTYAAIGEGVIRCQSQITYSILQSEVPTFRIGVPDDVTVLGVQGNDLRDWKTSQDKGIQYVDVYLNFGVKGNYVLSLNYERKIAEGASVVEIPWVRTTGVEREKGYFGIAAATNVELAVNKSDKVHLIDVRELPTNIWSSTNSPILLAFKYLNHPFNISIDVTKHEELPVLVAAIDSVQFITLQTDEGKSLTKAVYQVRNNVKQFLRLDLPKGATIWSVFVAGKPVKPAKDNKNDSVLIPLEKSQLSGENLAQFPVEIVYLDKTTKMKFLGSLKLHLPKTDLPISSLSWMVYLPMEYGYFNFGGDVKESRLPFERSRFSGVAKMREMADSMSRTQLGMEQKGTWGGDEYSDKSEQGVRGVLPIKIEVPEEGRLFSFSKLLVTEKESPWLSVWFIYGVKQVQGFIRFIVFCFVLFVVYRIIRRMFRKK